MQHFKKNFLLLIYTYFAEIIPKHQFCTILNLYFSILPIVYKNQHKQQSVEIMYVVVSSIKNSSRRRLRRAFFHFKCVKPNQGSTFTRSNLFDNNVFDAGDFENELNFL